MRCIICKYRPRLDGWDSSSTYVDICSLVGEDDVSECKYGGKDEIGCRFNQRTLDKRKRLLDEFYKQGGGWM